MEHQRFEIISELKSEDVVCWRKDVRFVEVVV